MGRVPQAEPAAQARDNTFIISPARFPIVVIGAGASGLATSIFIRRLNPTVRVLLVDGARRPGAKILVSGGGRCNVTNARVSEADFFGGSRAVIRQVLRAFSVADTVGFFLELGVALHEEPLGKLFPDSGRAKDVLAALLAEAERSGVERLDECRVLALEHGPSGFALDASTGPLNAAFVVLATGGQSLPKSGSDGFGFQLASRLGHTIVPPVPALVPLLLDPDAALRHATLAGIATDSEIAVWIDGRIDTRVRGSLLWTHFGISGPAALDVSRHWTRATAQSRTVKLTLSFCPGEGFDTVDARLVDAIAERPRALVQTLMSARLPTAVAAELLRAVGVDGALPAGRLTRDARRSMAHALVEWPLPVVGTRGYNYAEVTAGGVPLTEVDARTLESRVCRGLFLVGEVLDVDGRLGGFNFQWAWSSARVVAQALAVRVSE